MSARAPVSMKRRRFLQASLGAGGAFCLYVGYRSLDDQSRVPGPGDIEGAFKPNAYITITNDNRILFACNKSEMGQGILTAYVMLVAEELGVAVEKIEGYFADGAPEYRTGAVRVQVTGGSSGIPDGYFHMRTMGASAREMLKAAAAESWSVDAGTCEARDGSVSHAASSRRATFGELAAAASRQNIPDNPPLTSRDRFTVVGTSARRVDNVAKVTGTAGFGLDVKLPDMVKAVILHPPVWQGRVKSFDASDAKKLPGVFDVVAFERGVAVAADKIWQARQAAARVTVEWEDGANKGFNTETLFEELHRLEGAKGTVGRDDGDVEAALAQAGAKLVEGTYTAPLLAHAPMEPQNATVHVREDVIEVWAPVQGPSLVQETLAEAMGYERQRIIVHPTYLGGGFGRRTAPDLCIEAALLSKKLRRPVQVVWSRESDTRMGFYRPASVTRMRGAVSANGKPLAFWYHTLCQPMAREFRSFFGSMFPDAIPARVRGGVGLFLGRLMNSNLLGPELFTVEGAQGFPYKVPNVRIAHTPYSTPFSVWPWRSVGNSFNGFVVESFVDELADACGLDPYEFRRTYLPEKSRLRGVLERAATLGSWGKPTPGWHQGIASHACFGGYCAQVIEARIENGELRVGKVSAAIDVGIAVNPDQVAAQVQSAVVFALSAALHQQLEVVGGAVQQGNFDTYPALRMLEVGDINVDVVTSNREPSGAGEVGVPPTAPALAGAIYSATGIRIRSMPFLPALRQAKVVR